MAFRFGPKQYEWVQIGTQKWMTKNLDVAVYRNGDPIPEVKDYTDWYNLTTGAWCYYDNDIKNGAIYGKLYNWYAVDDPRGLAPEGWHIPTQPEWLTLYNYLVTESGGKLKETETEHWRYPNTGATNSTGFTALPGGWRVSNSNIAPTDDLYIFERGLFWTSTSNYLSNNLPLWAFLAYEYDNLFVTGGGGAEKYIGMSVRCIKD